MGLILTLDEPSKLHLYCFDCENSSCLRKGVFHEEDKAGCLKQVSSLVRDKFFHLKKEEIPFWKMYSQEDINKKYKEYIDFLTEKIYNQKTLSYYN